MELITEDSLKSFLGKSSYLTSGAMDEGNGPAASMAESIVLTKIGMDLESVKESALPTLTFCACAIFVYTTSFQQSLPSDQMEHRKELYDVAMETLNKIASGEINIANPSTDTDANSNGGFYCNSENRSERF